MLQGLKLLSAIYANQCDGAEFSNYAILGVENAEETMGGLENLLDVD